MCELYKRDVVFLTYEKITTDKYGADYLVIQRETKDYVNDDNLFKYKKNKFRDKKICLIHCSTSDLKQNINKYNKLAKIEFIPYSYGNSSDIIAYKNGELLKNEEVNNLLKTIEKMQENIEKEKTEDIEEINIRTAAIKAFLNNDKNKFDKFREKIYPEEKL